MLPVQMTHNLTLQAYQIYLYKKNGELVYYLTDPESDNSIVNAFTIEQDIDSIVMSAKMTLRLLNDSSFIELGDIIRIYGPVVGLDGVIRQKRIAHFFIMEIKIDADAYVIELELRDWGFWAKRDNYNIKIQKNETVTQFIRRSAQNAGFPIDNIADIPYVLDTELFEQATLYDVWLAVATRAMHNPDSLNTLLIRILFNPLGLRIDDVSFPDPIGWWFELDQTFGSIIKPNLSKSLLDADFVNEAVGVLPTNAGNDLLSSLSSSSSLSGLAPTKRNELSIQQHGLFRKQIDISNFSNNREANKHLEKIVSSSTKLEKLTFRTFALNSILPADRIFVTHPLLELQGEFFVKNITTMISDRSYFHEILALKRRDIPDQDLRKAVQATGVLSQLGS